ncbi:E8 early protein [Bos taurus papillomavirus 30]|nr:E8 early protein [Bos taurus papillomavirus 30]
MRLSLIYFLLLLWCACHFAALLVAIILFLLLISTINELHGWN